ncbi:MAG: MBOAT family O-acyltransferase [Spirochaetales bacterium]|nr:MBOAT family O-acyltransferase [Spirochaetales bacterium]
MLFNSYSFLIFFPITLLLYFLLPSKLKNLSLLADSYIFYMGWNAKYALLLLFCTAITFFSSLIIEKIKKSGDGKKQVKNRAILAVCISLIFCILFYFKYLNFFMELLAQFAAVLHIDFHPQKYSIVLPVGISFFSFQAVGYLIDVYRGDIYAERNFFRYALFVSFFPQLVAGPIERSKNLLKQLGKTYRFDFANLKNGFITMLYGYFLKIVVADRSCIIVDHVYSNGNATGIQIAFATFIFSFQIYCDFCGYTTIAIGAAKILGMNLTQNFNTPYFSASFQEFWRRWHISLSSWFKDYLYIPLGGSRKGRFRKNLNVMIVMLVSGLWHGAGVQYIFWGFLNGALQVFDDLTKNARKNISRFIQVPVTFVFVCLSWLFFRAKSMTEAIELLGRVFGNLAPASLFHDLSKTYGIGGVQIAVLMASIALMMTVDWFRYRNVSLKAWLLSKPWILQSLAVSMALLFILVFGVWGGDYNPAAFIYFQF